MKKLLLLPTMVALIATAHAADLTLECKIKKTREESQLSFTRRYEFNFDSRYFKTFNDLGNGFTPGGIGNFAYADDNRIQISHDYDSFVSYIDRTTGTYYYKGSDGVARGTCHKTNDHKTKQF